ncbi:GNAT family N-acetyltransferase [Flavobacterium salilacus subsp. salilacus]|uniref:GNAT family N-acetyltransferase n=1 Tax=Flavobacterium TaxID=237 RepID=UPI001074B431|nr:MULTISPECIES: GNAT family N-acetyltransferase [Flavobacterium]KAF2518271.1 GNAT family N-acetyltransferase [Flavobacterium salilacus subsp. salilacus]MBE1615318.1 GNAT family N-acetyltransferase [Flavobacterium sp. SaA2.13]
MKKITEVLNKSHNKSDFYCGKELLDNYIRKQASQDIKKDLSACYVFCEGDNKEVTGYYTLSSNSIDRSTLPPSLTKKLPPTYVNLPTVLLGRLAVDAKHQGKGLGKLLLIDALNQCIELSKTLGIIAVIVDPIDSEAIKFYESYGFILLPGSGKMFITIKTIEKTFLV